MMEAYSYSDPTRAEDGLFLNPSETLILNGAADDWDDDDLAAFGLAPGEDPFAIFGNDEDPFEGNQPAGCPILSEATGGALFADTSNAGDSLEGNELSGCQTLGEANGEKGSAEASDDGTSSKGNQPAGCQTLSEAARFDKVTLPEEQTQLAGLHAGEDASLDLDALLEAAIDELVEKEPYKGENQGLYTQPAVDQLPEEGPLANENQGPDLEAALEVAFDDLLDPESQAEKPLDESVEVLPTLDQDEDLDSLFTPDDDDDQDSLFSPEGDDGDLFSSNSPSHTTGADDLITTNIVPSTTSDQDPWVASLPSQPKRVDSNGAPLPYLPPWLLNLPTSSTAQNDTSMPASVSVQSISIQPGVDAAQSVPSQSLPAPRSYSPAVELALMTARSVPCQFSPAPISRPVVPNRSQPVPISLSPVATHHVQPTANQPPAVSYLRQPGPSTPRLATCEHDQTAPNQPSSTCSDQSQSPSNTGPSPSVHPSPRRGSSIMSNQDEAIQINKRPLSHDSFVYMNYVTGAGYTRSFDANQSFEPAMKKQKPLAPSQSHMTFLTAEGFSRSFDENLPIVPVEKRRKNLILPRAPEIPAFFQLSNLIFRDFEKYAKHFVLDLNHPQRYADGTKKFENFPKEIVQNMANFTKYPVEFLEGGAGEEYFGSKSAGYATRNLKWPAHKDELADLVLALFRRICKNEDQRLYAVRLRDQQKLKDALKEKAAKDSHLPQEQAELQSKDIPKSPISISSTSPSQSAERSDPSQDSTRSSSPEPQLPPMAESNDVAPVAQKPAPEPAQADYSQFVFNFMPFSLSPLRFTINFVLDDMTYLTIRSKIDLDIGLHPSHSSMLNFIGEVIPKEFRLYSLGVHGPHGVRQIQNADIYNAAVMEVSLIPWMEREVRCIAGLVEKTALIQNPSQDVIVID